MSAAMDKHKKKVQKYTATDNPVGLKTRIYLKLLA